MEARRLSTIATEIYATWPKIYFGARPYLDAMLSLDKITDAYGQDDAEGIVRYFLSNASSYRGDAARRIKTELKAML